MSNGTKIASWRARPRQPSGSSAPIAAHRPEQGIRHGAHAMRAAAGRPPEVTRSGARVLLAGRARASAARRSAARSPWRRRRCSLPGPPRACRASRRLSASANGSCILEELARRSSSGSSSGAVAGSTRARTPRARSATVCLCRLAGRSRRSTKSGVAVVVQVLEILGGPAVGAAPARSGGPRHLVAAHLDGADRGVARRARGRRRRRAQERTGMRCSAMPLEIDLDGREAVARRRRSRSAGHAAARSGAARRSRRAARAGRRSATRPRRDPDGPGLDALAGGAADARAHLGHDVERALVDARRSPSSSRSATMSASVVSCSVTRRPRAIRSSRPSEMSVMLTRVPPPARAQPQQREDEHDRADGCQHPDPGCRCRIPGAAAAEEGSAAAASAAAASAQAREVRARGGLGVDRWLVTLVASASSAARSCPPRRGISRPLSSLPRS